MKSNFEILCGKKKSVRTQTGNQTQLGDYDK